MRCDCGEQLESALSMIEAEGAGVLLYLAQEGRGIGLLNKLHAYKLQEEGLDTVDANLKLGLPADLRDYGIGAQILVDLGLSSIRILTNNPKKIHGLEGYGLSVTDQVPIQAVPNPHNEAYLRAKRERLGHALHHQGKFFRVYGALHASLCGHAQVRPQFLVELRLVGFPAPEDHRVLTKSFLLPMANRLKSRPGLARRPWHPRAATTSKVPGSTASFRLR